MSKTIDPKTSAVLLLDLQQGFLERLPSDTTESIVDNTQKLIETARNHGVKIHYIHAALTEEEINAIPDNDSAFSAIKANKDVAAAMTPTSPKTQIHEKLQPRSDEKVFRKIRYGAFMRGPSMELLDEFRSSKTETILVAGVVTSGAVLSAVRQLADLDYRLIVIKDCCGEYDPVIHDFVCDKILTKQAQVIDTESAVKLFSN